MRLSSSVSRSTSCCNSSRGFMVSLQTGGLIGGLIERVDSGLEDLVLVLVNFHELVCQACFDRVEQPVEPAQRNCQTEAAGVGVVDQAEHCVSDSLGVGHEGVDGLLGLCWGHGVLLVL